MNADRPLRVLVLTNLFPNPFEPMRSTFNEQQVLAMSRLVEIAEVVVPVDWRRMISFRRRGRGAEIAEARTWRGLPVSYPTILYIPLVGRWLNGPLMFLSLARHWPRLRRLGAQVIFATWAYPDGFAAVLLGALARVPVVVKVHGSDVEHLDADRIRRALTVWALGRAARVVSVARYLKDALVRHGLDAGRIAVVYNGLDRDRFKPRDRLQCRAELGLDPARRLVAYVGNLKDDKGVLDLAAAAAEFCQPSGAMLCYVGDGPARQLLEEEVRTRGLQEHVRLLGKVPHEQIPTWICAADLLCLPSHHEGVPNVILEATACGVPTVATAVGGVPEVVSPANGVLVPAHDPRALAGAIARALDRHWEPSAVRGALRAGAWAENAASVVALLQPEEAQ